MIDIKLIREHPKEVEEKLKRKDSEIDLGPIIDIDNRIRALKTKGEQLKAQRNQISKQIGEMKRKGEDASQIMEEVSGMSAEIHAIDHELQPLEEKFTMKMARIPNIPMDDIKVSQDPQDNVIVKEVGKKPQFDFPFKNHLELNENLHLFAYMLLQLGLFLRRKRGEKIPIRVYVLSDIPKGILHLGFYLSLL